MTPVTSDIQASAAIHDFVDRAPVYAGSFSGEFTVTPDVGISITMGGRAVTLEPQAPTLASAHLDSLFTGVLGELRRYSRYARGWDGYRGEVFDPDVLRVARIVLRVAQLHLARSNLVPRLFTTGPASDGSIDVEVATDRKRLIFTLYPGSTNVEIYREVDGKPSGESRPLERLVLDREFSWLLRTSVSQVALDETRRSSSSD